MISYNSSSICPYHEYYTNQAGTGIGPIFKGQFYQRGHGIGCFLRGIWRMAVPLIKKGARAVGSEALKSGSNFIDDVVENKPIKESLKIRAREAGRNLKNKAIKKCLVKVV